MLATHLPLPVPGRSTLGGRGLMASRAYAVGERILEERPVLTAAEPEPVPGAPSTAAWELTRILLEGPAHAELRAWIYTEFARHPQIFVANGNPHAWSSEDVAQCRHVAALLNLSERYVKQMYAAVAMINLTVSLPGSGQYSIGIYPLLSYINHSCAANASLELYGEQRVLLAAKPIAPGEEITMLYMHPSMMQLPSGFRRQYLREVFGFQCTCPECRASS